MHDETALSTVTQRYHGNGQALLKIDNVVTGADKHLKGSGD